jgi:hypothetical protein
LSPPDAPEIKPADAFKSSIKNTPEDNLVQKTVAISESTSFVHTQNINIQQIIGELSAISTLLKV